jgi:hypothetical protein
LVCVCMSHIRALRYESDEFASKQLACEFSAALAAHYRKLILIESLSLTFIS